MIVIKYLGYYKSIFIFIIIQILLAFIISLFELMSIDAGMLHLFSLIANIILYITFGYKYGKKTRKKAIYEGILLGSIFDMMLIVINLIFFRTISSLSIIYYLCLLIMAIFGSIYGKNHQKKSYFR